MTREFNIIPLLWQQLCWKLIHRHTQTLCAIVCDLFYGKSKESFTKKKSWQFCCLVRRFSIGLKKFFLWEETKSKHHIPNTFLPFGILIFYHPSAKGKKKFFLLSRTAKRDNSNILVHCFRISNLRHIMWPFFGEKER